MAEKRKAALILEEWVLLMNDLPPKDYKIVFSALCNYRISGQTPPPGMTAQQKAILGLMMREAKLMDEASERKRQYRESHGTVPRRSQDSPETVSGQSQDRDAIEVEGEKEEEGEPLSSESGVGAAPAAPPPAISEEQKQKLIEGGIPAAYIEYFCDTCEAKGYHYDKPTAACKAWWKKDKSRPEWQQTQSLRSFDTDEFWDAAVKKSMGGE